MLLKGFDSISRISCHVYGRKGVRKQTNLKRATSANFVKISGKISLMKTKLGSSGREHSRQMNL